MTEAEIEADRKEKTAGIKLLIKHSNQIIKYNVLAEDSVKTEFSEYLKSISKTDFSKETYENVVLAYKTLKEYLKTVTYTDHSAIQVFISTEKDNGLSLVKSQGYQASVITVVRKDGTVICTDDLSKMKVRGNSTSLTDKKPFTIKFDKKVELIEGAGKEKKWVVLAEWYDKTLLRDAVMLDLAKKMEMPYTSEHEYAKLYLDGKYRGIYMVTEPVEIKEHRVDIDTSKGEFLADLNKFRTSDGDIYNGLDKARDRNGVCYVKPIKNSSLRFEIKDSEDLTNEEYQAIADKITMLFNVIRDNVNEPGGFEKIKEIADVESFAKLYFIHEFAKSVDMDQFSMFLFYKDGKFYGGPAWDFDLSLGNASQDGYPNYWNSVNGKAVSWAKIYGKGPMFQDLKKYDEFNDLVKQIFVKYSPDIKNIIYGTADDFGSIAYYRAIYDEAFATNFSTGKGGAGWSVKVNSTTAYSVYSNYEDGVTYLIDFIKNRYDWLYNYWGIQVAEVPAAVEKLVYDGTEKAGVTEGTGYSLEGVNATDAGTYTAVATLKPGYIWPEEAVAPIELTWTIAKAEAEDSTKIINDVTEVCVDEIPLNKDMYVISDEGNVVISKHYMNGLSVGEHTVTLKYNNYQDISYSMTVEPKPTPTNTPTPIPTPTEVPAMKRALGGDGTLIIILSILAVIGVVVVIRLVTRLKKLSKND